jgi:hypothetical protein
MSETVKLPKGIRKIEPSGRYQVRYTGPDGKRNSGGTFRRKTDAERALAKITAQIDNERETWRPPRRTSDQGPNPKTLTVRDLSEEWIKGSVNNAGKQLAPKTVEAYRRLIDHPLAEFAEKPARQIHSEDVQEWWNRAEFGKARTRKGLMQVKGTPKVANPEGWLEGCSSCLTLIQVSSVATLSLSR